MPPLSHITYCIHNKYNLLLLECLLCPTSPTVYTINLIYTLLIHRLLLGTWPMQTPYISCTKIHGLFHCVGHMKGTCQARDTCTCFVTRPVSKLRSCYHHAKPPNWRTSPRVLIQYFCSYPPYWMSFLHPQPKEAPCRSDRDPLHESDILTCAITHHFLIKSFP